jgi:hypothetical protein
MADASIAVKDVEEWIRNEFLPKKYKQAFTKRKLGLQSGGEIYFDAVSEDGTIVCFITVTASRTPGEKPGSDMLAKIRSDALWAISLSEKPETVLFAFTDASMIELVKKEKEHGRFPKNIKTLLVKLPGEIENKVVEK